MKITEIETWFADLPLSVPYTIAYRTYTSAPTVFVRIETSWGISGFGAANPDRQVTGETAETVQRIIDEEWTDRLTGKDPLRYVQLLELLHPSRDVHTQHPSALACIDMALHDIIGKYAGLPVWKLLGGYRTRIATSITVGILPADETAEKIAAWEAAGAGIIKLKGGLNVDEDIDKLTLIYRRFGKSLRFRFDANQGYTADDARKFIASIPRGMRMELLEQPVPAGWSDVMGALTSPGSLPIMADESILGLQDAYHLVRRNLIDMINIKLMKCGGITNALHINSVARAAGKEVMVGCMDETQLGIAAGLHFALSRPNIQFADLDGHMELLQDPTAGCVTYRDGYLYPSRDDGFGWSG